jgi:hypothetical protein
MAAENSLNPTERNMKVWWFYLYCGCLLISITIHQVFGKMENGMGRGISPLFKATNTLEHSLKIEFVL